jgi:hypothetical protein
MNAAPSVTAPLVTAAPVPVASCVVCPHPLVDHDRISLRFCQATQAQGADADAGRGCVCPN